MATKSSRVHPRDPCIPGLVRQAFTKGSRHSAPCPTLKTSNVNQQSCHFEWEAKGSGGAVYEIQATGSLSMKFIAGDDQVPLFTGLKVTCSCPDGARQAAASLSLDKIIVCKHAAAALESVLDAEAESRYKSNVARLRQQRVKAAAQQRRQEEQAKQVQEQEMPGERTRIEYGLVALTQDEIKKQLLASCKTVEGLRALAVIFPETVVPEPQTKHCVRCKKDYDERYSDQKVCRVEHPHEHCHTQWDGSKISWEHCYRCDRDFDVPDTYGRSRDAPYDMGKWCFEGEHTQDEDLVKEEKWDADPGDLVY